MKINWGTGLAIFYATFVIVMIAIVVKASRTDINMVQENYYDHDLNYEAFRKSRENGSQDKTTINYVAASQEIIIQFDQSLTDIAGQIKLYRPSDHQKDQNLVIDLDTKNRMHLDVKGAAKGYWKVLIDYEHQGKKYFKEQVVIL
ncbi:MAG: hypothetical protein HKN76_20470 [Saprospiraceae bacterium]|nr:hypothetical protein [Saprospiraceae bacterium]